MARTIKEIQDAIISVFETESGLTLSSSKVAEWRLWTYVFAAAIHTFEIILDMFREEVDTLVEKVTPGTVRWYAEMCYRFQNGHELSFDPDRAMLYYPEDDEQARIVKVVAIREETNRLVIKAAKQDEQGNIVPLSLEERYNFAGYIDAIKFAGVDTSIVSTTEDRIRYRLEVYYDPATPLTQVNGDVLTALDTFKSSLGFDSMIYRQQFIDAVMDVPGVTTCNLLTMERKGATDEDFLPVDICAELESGYFEYDGDSSLVLKSVKVLEP
ncbi:hypothetical protein [Bacteroides gallinarum]|uniref:hypothetical protein n=1 Tax=Bacteroides gallinarum TaxID=376806 RepID=UPI00037D3F6B|nr:hypothetical protein [Bacteroides gallinarum]